jgi:hypothetical protein
MKWERIKFKSKTNINNKTGLKKGTLVWVHTKQQDMEVIIRIDKRYRNLRPIWVHIDKLGLDRHRFDIELLIGVESGKSVQYNVSVYYYPDGIKKKERMEMFMTNLDVIEWLNSLYPDRLQNVERSDKLKDILSDTDKSE